MLKHTQQSFYALWQKQHAWVVTSPYPLINRFVNSRTAKTIHSQQIYPAVEMQALLRTLRCDLKREGKGKKKKGHSRLGLYQISVVVTGARLLQGHLLCSSELHQDSVPLQAAALPALVGTQPGHLRPAETAVQPSTPPACRTRSCVTPAPPHLTRILLGFFFFLGHRPATREERNSPTASERAHYAWGTGSNRDPHTHRPRRGSPRPSHLTTHPGKGRRRAAGPVPPAAATESPSGDVPSAEIPSETPGAQQRARPCVVCERGVPAGASPSPPAPQSCAPTCSAGLHTPLLSLPPSSLSADVALALRLLGPAGRSRRLRGAGPRAGPPPAAPLSPAPAWGSCGAPAPQPGLPPFPLRPARWGRARRRGEGRSVPEAGWGSPPRDTEPDDPLKDIFFFFFFPPSEHPQGRHVVPRCDPVKLLFAPAITGSEVLVCCGCRSLC